MMTYKKILLAGMAIALTGCATTNPCDGKHGGICTPPREVYGVTDNRDQVHPTNETMEEQRRAIKLLHEKPSKRDILPAISPASILSQGGEVGPLTQEYQAHKGPQPLLSQPHVLRVWIAPWSHKGNLHFPGYVYTIVSPEQWVFAPHKGQTPIPAPMN